LTRREIDIVRAVVSGYTNKEIAERSSITENTVKSHLTHIFDKLGASNRVELALFAAHHRLLDGEKPTDVPYDSTARPYVVNHCGSG
jgi:two-component system nitrate/nitrite response regulator NarL